MHRTVAHLAPRLPAMFRDSRGVVHTVSSADPLEDLPPGVALALQDALLAPARDGDPIDLGTVIERCDAVRELVERWQDAYFAALPEEVDLDEEARWAAEAGLSLPEVEAGYEQDDEDDDELDLELLGANDDEDDDELEDLELLLTTDGATADEDPRQLLPEQLVSVLERELLLLSVRVRLEALVATVDLVEGWSDLLSDHEKLLGHLVLAHGDVPEPRGSRALVHEWLAGRHGALHQGQGPGHPEVEADPP